MATVVIIPGGFHPYHAGHLSLYQSAQRAFPDADVYVAATDDRSQRPFPFKIKEKLAYLAGVEPGHFVQVKSPFRAEEITSQFNPEKDTLIFVRSTKDAKEPPHAGGVLKTGKPAYLQPLLGAKRLEPFARHAYMAYLPTVEFGPGITSASEIRAAWPGLDPKRKTAMVMSLYPRTQGNAKLAATVVKMLDTAIGSPMDENQGWAATFTSEDISRRGFLKGAGAGVGLAAAGSSLAAPFKHFSSKDQMTGEKTADVSRVKSDDSKAILELHRGQKPMVVVEVPGAIFNAGRLGTSCRYKIGDGPVVQSLLAKPSSGAYDWGAILPDYQGGKDLSEKILAHSGKVLFEVDLYRIGPKVFTFTIEQDSQTAQAQKDYSAAQQKNQIVQQEKETESQSIEAAIAKLEQKIKEKENILDREIYKVMSDRDAYLKVKNEQSKLMRIGNELHKAKMDKITSGDWPSWLKDYVKTNTLPPQWLGIQENESWPATFTSEETRAYAGQQGAGMTAGYQRRENQPVDEDYIDEKWSQKYKRSIDCSHPKGFSQRAHCQGRKK